MTRERLSDGARRHNRNEKSAARREHRVPVLLRPSAVESPRKTIRFAMTEKPNLDEIMSASRRLAAYCEGVEVENRRSDEYLSDGDAVKILRDLQDGIETGRILSRAQIAQEVGELGFMIGEYGSVSTDLDIASFYVLGAIEVNKKRIAA